MQAQLKSLVALTIFVTSVAVVADQTQPGQTDILANAQFEDWINAGSKIAFVCDREGQSQPDEICVMNANGTGERRVTPTNDFPNPPCHSLFPHWSPSGQQIAYHCARINEIGRATNDVEIFVIDIDGTTVYQLTESGCPQLNCPGMLGAASPKWSPDGGQIAFHSTKESAPHIYIINTDGTGLRGPLTAGARPDWSPDGRRIVFQRSGQIFVVDLDDPALDDPATAENAGKQLTFGATNQFARWSPNGQRITFQSPVAGVPQVFVMDAEGSDQVQITHFYTDPNGAPSQNTVPSWSPDGRWILFHRQMCDPSPELAPNGSDLFAAAADGSGQEIRLTDKSCPGGVFGPQSTVSAIASWAPGALHSALVSARSVVPRDGRLPGAVRTPAP